MYPLWFTSELNGKDHIKRIHRFREGRGCFFYECLRTYGLEWYGSRAFFDQRKEATQSIWMDLALARHSGQELHNAYYMTQRPEFGPLRRFLTAAVAQLQLAFDDLPVPSRQPPSTATPLLESMRADIDLCDLPSEDNAVADSTPESSHADTGATDSLPPVVSVVDITPPARRLTPANQSLRFLKTKTLTAARPDCVPSRPAVPDLCIASSRLLSCIDPMLLDRLLCHTVATVNAWPPADRSHLLAVAHRDLCVARQNIADLQYYVDDYAAHLSDCAGA